MTRVEGGKLSAADAGRDVTLQGWIAHRRDFGELVFATLRDRSGVVQVLFPENADRALVELAKTLRAEDVVEIEGAVARRAAGQENPAMATGEIEIVARKATVLNRSVLERSPSASSAIRRACSGDASKKTMIAGRSVNVGHRIVSVVACCSWFCCAFSGFSPCST